MALADPSAADACLELSKVTGEAGLEPALDRVGPGCGVGAVAADLVKIHPEDSPEPIGAAVAAGRRRDRLSGLHGGDRHAELPACGSIDPPRLEAGIEPVGLVKLRELHRPLDRLAEPVDMGRLRRAGDRHRRQVEPRREAPIEADLLGAEMPAPVERGEVEKLELARLLHLVGKRPGEKHPGDVGFNELDRADRMGIGRRLEELFNQGRSRRPRH